MPRIVPLLGSDDRVVAGIRRIRSDGDVPLVLDERMPEAHLTAVRALVDEAAVPSDAAWATLTSGSTGVPRVVVRTDASWRSSHAAVSDLLDAGPADGIALPAPPASSLTLFSLAHAEAGGPRPVLVGRDGDARGAVCFHGTPQGLARLLAAGGTTPLRTALVGGAALDPALRAEAEARGIRVVAYYGAAELSFVAIDAGDGLRPFPGVDVDVRNGRLWVRSSTVAIGYLGRPGALRRDGGWATVGDLAELVGGRLLLRGRADGAILTAAATVVPEEVEAALRTLSGVADAVVFGLPVPGIGALVAALVEPRASGPGLDVASLRSGAAAVLAPASRPRVWFAGPVPRTAAGKPARAEAIRRATSGEADRLAG
ncbi:class I adenylate-forming enzyme family protein [Clavibacter sp. CT19]|uniref:class I adenylate-forming enzyme family protein n=1 Tax=Clavibacter sp. CT19 TaxID=3018990 RepID=UPI0022EB412E|nr:class I adenylate-forming enzyme family protein [Clavibacter sp. CT19]MDA3803642.1 class I adenylate-forming enzyme family protein [Clavibacter sp. CT19]